jgi:hypothetical protein
MTNENLKTNSSFIIRHDNLKRSKSMKKLKQLQDEFKYEMDKNKLFNFEKSLNNEKLRINESYSKFNLKTNQIIRNGSLNHLTLKRENSLNNLLNKTETRYIPRSNSKIMKTIENMKSNMLLDNKKSSRRINKDFIYSFFNNKENSYLNSNLNNKNLYLNKKNLGKKNFFGQTSKLLYEQNYRLNNNKDNSFESSFLSYSKKY